jgi:hypothetical protein
VQFKECLIARQHSIRSAVIHDTVDKTVASALARAGDPYRLNSPAFSNLEAAQYTLNRLLSAAT